MTSEGFALTGLVWVRAHQNKQGQCWYAHIFPFLPSHHFRVFQVPTSSIVAASAPTVQFIAACTSDGVAPKPTDFPSTGRLIVALVALQVLAVDAEVPLLRPFRHETCGLVSCPQPPVGRSVMAGVCANEADCARSPLPVPFSSQPQRTLPNDQVLNIHPNPSPSRNID